VTELVFGRRYRVVEKIGSGGMAEVYKAVDDVLGRTVAVKVLHAQYASDPGFVARFRQEAQAAANLSSPNIVNIFDWGRDDETYYIVMEYVHGADLKSLVEENGPIDPLKAAEYGSQVCAALTAAHGYDIVHRDIKPQNIVLTPDGVIKVMDFGIARAGNSTMTQTGSVLGTAHYVSPEQAQGRDLGPQSDLYSLGVVLYELTTGQVPFDAEGPVAVALKQVNEEPVPPRQLNPDIPPSMEAVILRAMSKRTADRYTSAEEMRRDLQRVASGRVVETPVAAAAGGTAVMSAVGDTRVRPVPSKRKRWPWVVAIIVGLTLIGIGAAYAFGLLGGPEKIVVPDVTGMTEEEAVEALQAVGLTLGDTEETNSEEVEAGLIISQSPEPGVDVELGSSVKIVISAGRELFEVPDVVGLTESEAIEALRAAGFQVGSIDRQYNSEVDADSVISQDPVAGQMVPTATAITLVVSRGTELREVPDVVGDSKSDAEARLSEAGFKSTSTEEFSDSVDRGDVIRQSPQGGVSVEVGSTVTIVISKGPDVVTVPYVIGELEADAIQMIEDAGLVAVVNYQTDPRDGEVITQDPVPDTEVKRGETVNIWVGNAPPAP
jgi:serine/threonine-protein kinase